MSQKNAVSFNPWPELSYEQFKSTQHLLHMASQIIGKLKLKTPFEPHWANVALWPTSRGVTTGLIPHALGCFSIDMDILSHELICSTTWGRLEKIPLKTMSVANLYENIFRTLKQLNIDQTINLKPQEIEHPVPFDQDNKVMDYDPTLALAWFNILISTYRVLQRYHALFTGRTPAVGFMWGTFDLRDARYRNVPVPTTGINAGYIRRNAMDVAQIEAGWWSGNEAYPRGAYFSFTYPQPRGIEEIQIKPNKARWDKKLSEFILDYDDLRHSKNPEQDLLDFFETTYRAGAEQAGWSKKLIGEGEPA